jgi:hypothetical protein
MGQKSREAPPRRIIESDSSGSAAPPLRSQLQRLLKERDKLIGEFPLLRRLSVSRSVLAQYDVARAPEVVRLWDLERRINSLRLELSRSDEELERKKVKRRNKRRRKVTPEALLKPENIEATRELVHSEDYISVTLHGRTWVLTSRQAQMIKILHEAHESGMPDVRIDRILVELGATASQWQDTWKSSPEARRALIKSGLRKGTLRLNL